MEHWITKFRCAFRGLWLGTQRQSSFVVHMVFSVAVIICATWLRCEPLEWTILLLCIGLVLSLELGNSAIERLAKGLCKEHNQHVGAALDIASGAVLVASIVSAIVGLIIFVNRFLAFYNF